MDLEEIKKETAEISRMIAEKTGTEDWKAETRFIDMVEEVGELANALMVEHGFKGENRRRAELVDSICDILFDLLILANHFKVDLNKEYPKVLKQIEERTKRGEFD